jgi:predicted nucleic acid-binding protein
VIVVDVTVLAYYLIRGEATESVVALRRRDPEWAAPSLWRSELMNVLWKYVRRGDFSVELALEHFDLASDLVGPRTFEVGAAEVLPLAVASGCSAYDCHYVALAERLGLPLATHDRRVLEAFPERAALPDRVRPTP